jgi:hypothetical protein
MPEKYLYEYAVIRLVPKVEREEFLNVGVILFSKQAKYIRVLYKLDAERLNAFDCELEIEEVEKNLQSFDKICCGKEEAGRFADWELADRFRWLTAVRSSSIQTSRPHNGFSADLDKTLERLFEEQVL